jgi:hypothetical protein
MDEGNSLQYFFIGLGLPSLPGPSFDFVNEERVHCEIAVGPNNAALWTSAPALGVLKALPLLLGVEA